MRSRTLLGCVAVIMTAVIATGCSKEQRQELVNDTVEVAARNIAKEGGEERFADEGIQVADGLECSSTSDVDAGTVSVDCTGSSTDGAALTLTGQLSVADGEIVDSSGFIGEADGKEVFSEDCVGEACSLGS
jgi:hypothetical protein